MRLLKLNVKWFVATLSRDQELWVGVGEVEVKFANGLEGGGA